MLSQLLPMLAITFTVFVLFFIFMGIGYMVKKKPLKGSCGGSWVMSSAHSVVTIPINVTH